MAYALEKSPFYRLESKAKLAELLRIPLNVLLEIAEKHEDHYEVFDKEVRGKTRHIEHPKKKLEKIQRQITSLLQRIHPPDYLHSAWKGRSYITNARQHDCSQRMGKIDIKKFFPSTKAHRVSDCFERYFLCSPDVAWVITQLTTFQGHIPTGGMTSTILAFFAYKDMFDKANALAVSRGLKMTCVVDDMAFSGAKASPEFINSVAMIIRSYGLSSHKRKHFDPGQPRIVTGVTVTSKGMRLPNARRKKLHESVQALVRENDPILKRNIARKLQGRAVEAAQIEPRFDTLVEYAANQLAAANKACVQI